MPTASGLMMEMVRSIAMLYPYFYLRRIKSVFYQKNNLSA
uniref:Uncharacterized protein n=1 Tax=Neisseria meningitidis alpha522 TaxID=996307 RepID=I4E581_NEIME|nr:hypothetical protein NMALPHA522_0956 [Neisseria meningitidis alpha522]